MWVVAAYLRFATLRATTNQDHSTLIG